MKKAKFYDVHGECTDKLGHKHTVTLVGKLEYYKEAYSDTKGNENVMTTMFTKVKRKRLSIGMSICHSMDTFDEEIGKKLAMRRIKHKQAIGVLETSTMLMLSKDAVMAELLTTLSMVTSHIDQFLPKTIERYRREDGAFDMAGATEEEIIAAAAKIKDDEKIILGEGKELKKSDFQTAMHDAFVKLIGNPPTVDVTSHSADDMMMTLDEEMPSESAANAE